MASSPYFSEHGIPIRNLWHMLLYAWNEPSTTIQVSLGDVEDAPTMDALFATILLKMFQQRMRTGLGRGYVDASKKMGAVRGRVDFTESIKQQTFDHGEAVCDFQEYSVNEMRNQILRGTLVNLVKSGEFGPSTAKADALRHRVRWLVRNLNDVDNVDLDLEAIRRLILAQNENDYRLMLSICELVMMRQMPHNTEGRNALPGIDRAGLILHRIYERFVSSFYKMHLKGWDVSAQKQLDWHAQQENEHLPSMVPDLILQEQATGRIIILDTKFTAASLVENQWGKLVYDSSHLYQLYAYLRSQEQVSAGYRSAEGVLLYPAVKTHPSERVELHGHVIRVECVDLAAAWEEVERQLLRLVE